ncbi:MAG: ABC transporter permease [Gemmatimonadota bacterium]
MTERTRVARRLYRLLLRAWPRSYRDAYGAEMEDAFMALLRLEGERAGGLGRARAWAGAVLDAGISGPGARVRFGSNQGWGGDTMGTLWADIRYAVRSLKRRPVFAATAVLTIAVGIGANSAVFTVVNGFMVQPLPYEEPHELVSLFAGNPEQGYSGTDVNPADAADWGARSTSLEDVAVLEETAFNWTGGDVPEQLAALRVTTNFLSLIGWQPALGRDFLPEEDAEGGDASVILMDGFWERRFARDRSILGTTLILDGETVTIVGVMPPDFLYYDMRPDLLRPWGVDVSLVPRGGHYAEALGRMASGVTIDATREELEAIARELEAEHPENAGWTVEVISLKTNVVGPIAAAASVVLMGAVGFILLMACVNVANLLLARAGSRNREVAVRAALGAGRGRIMRQLLTESVLLAMVGGALGLVGAVWGYKAIVAGLPPTLPPVFTFEMDGSVLSFTAFITVGAAVLFGILPAVRTTSDLGSTLRDAGRAGTSRGASRFGSALVILQTAMAVVLLVGGSLLMKSVTEMQNRDFGFRPENVLTARIALPEQEYDSREASTVYWTTLTDRVRALPGVLEAGTTQSHPLMGSNWGRTIRVEGQDVADDRGRRVRLTLASPGLFEAIGFELSAGRVFTDADDFEGQRVAIVNESFVERYLGPDDDPLQQTILSGETFRAPIVGVVRNAIERAVDADPEPSLYLPIAQQDVRTRSLVIRTNQDPTTFVSRMQEAVWSIDGDIPVSRVQTMTSLVRDRVGGFAIIGQLMGIFAVLSLILGAVGIYGVTAYAAGQRRSEIGVRLAMGAERTDVVRMVVREGARRAAVGIVIGLVLATAMGGAIQGILVGVAPRDPVILGTVTAVITAVSLFGLWLPARRASRVDPVRALTGEG